MVEGTCIGFRGRNALLQLETQQIIEWPISNLPNNFNRGDKFKLNMITQNDQYKAELQAKKQLLQELIN